MTYEEAMAIAERNLKAASSLEADRWYHTRQAYATTAQAYIAFARELREAGQE